MLKGHMTLKLNWMPKAKVALYLVVHKYVVASSRYAT